MRYAARNGLLALACALSSVIGWAQGRNIGFDWPASGADAQRTAWLRLDPNISADNLVKPGFEFLWREKLENAPRLSASLSQGVTMNGLIGFTPASFITGASNNVFAVDNDTGYPVWHRRLDAQLPSPTADCPGGITGAAGRVVSLVRDPLQLPPAAVPGRGYRGGMGEAGEGVPMEIARRDGGAALRGVPAPIPAARGGGVFAGRYAGPVYVVSSNGTLHALGQVSGKDLERPAPFLPPNARYSDLTAIGDMLYTSTSRECGGVPNGVWAITLDPKSKTVSSWKTNGGSPVGNLAFTASGRIIVAIGAGKIAPGGYANAIVALDAKTLQPVDWFTSPAAEFVATPVVINQGGREIVAAVARGGIYLLDAAALGGATHATPLFVLSGTNLAPDALASFEQPAGTPWLLVPSPRAVTAFRIAQEGGTVSLQPGWTSREIAAPAAPIVVNDVVFAAASGRPQGAALLYALDAKSGKELWNSGKTMTSWVPAGNLWASNSQVHVGTHDGTVYAFGYSLERR
jgi:outer membrane protein assembly factor BamB